MLGLGIALVQWAVIASAVNPRRGCVKQLPLWFVLLLL